MIKGIGIDTVSISEMNRYMESFGDVFINRTFTEKEVAMSRSCPQPAEYLATRFAAKEAVFKAIAHLTEHKGFDLRIVETLNEPDGFPVVQMKGRLLALADEAGVTAIHIAMTTEQDLATAFVVAESI
jgi:holo-[acyl-carrier protein] synthase